MTFCKSHGQGQVRLNIPAPRPGPCPLDNPSLYVIALPFSTKNALDLRGVVTLNSGLLDPCSLSPLSPKRKRCLAGRRVVLCGAWLGGGWRSVVLGWRLSWLLSLSALLTSLVAPVPCGCCCFLISFIGSKFCPHPLYIPFLWVISYLPCPYQSLTP